MTGFRSAVSRVLFTPVLLAISLLPSEAAKMQPGQEAFERHCFVCHPKGGNVITPAKTLRKDALDKNGIRTAQDIIGKIRNPGPAMTKFDEAAIPDATAREIAEYILRTF